MGFKDWAAKNLFGIDNYRYSNANGQHEYWQTTNYNVLSGYVSLLDKMGGYSEANMLKIACTLPEVFAPIWEIASRVMRAKWVLKDANGEVIENNKDFNRLTGKVNYQETFAELLFMAVFYKYATGNRYFYKYIPETLPANNTSYIKAVWMLQSDKVTINLLPSPPNKYVTTGIDQLVRNYRVDDGVDTIELKPESVYHDAYVSLQQSGSYSTQDKLKGTSPLLACIMPITTIYAVHEATGTIFQKGGILGLLISKKGDKDGLDALTPNEKNELMQDLQSRSGLTDGRTPFGITRYPLDFLKMGMSIKDLEPFMTLDANTARIYTCIGVDPELMPRKDNSTYENLSQAEKNTYNKVVIPEANEIANILTAFWGFDAKGYTIHADFSHIEVLQEDKKLKAELDSKNHSTYYGRFVNGLWTLNDWLTAIGKEPVSTPLYDKLIYDMTPEEQDKVKQVINIRSNATGNNADGGQGTTGSQQENQSGSN